MGLRKLTVMLIILLIKAGKPLRSALSAWPPRSIIVILAMGGFKKSNMWLDGLGRSFMLSTVVAAFSSDDMSWVLPEIEIASTPEGSVVVFRPDTYVGDDVISVADILERGGERPTSSQLGQTEYTDH